METRMLSRRSAAPIVFLPKAVIIYSWKEVPTRTQRVGAPCCALSRSLVRVVPQFVCYRECFVPLLEFFFPTLTWGQRKIPTVRSSPRCPGSTASTATRMSRWSHSWLE